MFIYISFACVNIHLKILYVVSRKSAETLHTRRIHTSHRVGVASDKGGGAGGGASNSIWNICFSNKEA